jgi:hypothetical protein
MTYTVIYKDYNSGVLGTFTFVSRRHDKDYAWSEFMNTYATPDQELVAIMPGNQIVYFSQHIS